MLMEVLLNLLLQLELTSYAMRLVKLTLHMHLKTNVRIGIKLLLNTWQDAELT